MELETLLKAIAKGIVLPPGILVWMLLIGIYLDVRKKFLGMTLIIISSLLLYAISTPIAAYYLTAKVESVGVIDPEAAKSAQIIVVLGAGRRSAAPEYEHQDTVSDQGLARLRYGAELSQRFSLPMLVTGGKGLERGPSEAELMKKVLQENFGIDEVWTENESFNTYENATLTKNILDSRRIERILLVTHAFHMPRAQEAFEMAGMDVVPAPMGFLAGDPPTPVVTDFLPNVGSLLKSRTSLHELVGRLWYKLRHY